MSVNSATFLQLKRQYPLQPAADRQHGRHRTEEHPAPVPKRSPVQRHSLPGGEDPHRPRGRHGGHPRRPRQAGHHHLP